MPELQRNVFILAEQKTDKTIFMVSPVSQWNRSHINWYVFLVVFAIESFIFEMVFVKIGETEFQIGDVRRPITTWLSLSDSRHNESIWGELMFSLSYLPTAERLTVVVVKARNLKLPEEQQVSLQNVFVKVNLENGRDFSFSCFHHPSLAGVSTEG